MRTSLCKLLALCALGSTGFARAESEYQADAHTVALWRFDRWQGPAIPDDGPDSLDLVRDTVLALAGSPEDSALVLEGRGGLKVADTTRISVGRTGQLTYQARIWLEEYPSAGNHNRFAFLMGKYEGMGLFIRSDGRLSVNNQKGNGTSWMWYAPVTAPNAVPLRRWVEVAAACDQAAAECYCYVDGKAQATYTYMVGESYSPLPQYAGNRFRSPSSPLTVGYNARDGQAFKGQIEAIKISDALVYAPGPRAITIPDTAQPEPGAIASWDFDEGAGDTLHDRTGNGHHGVIHGARWVDGVQGKALQFAGQEWVEVPGDSATRVKSFTFSVWLKQSGNGSRVPILEFHEPNALVGVHLWANTSGWGVPLPGAFYANLRPHDASASQPGSVRERNLLNTGAGSAQGARWNHVVLVLDHDKLHARMYVNGKLAAAKLLDPFTPRTTGSLFLGMRTPHSLDGDANIGLVGYLDRADLFGRALTEAEVLDLYGQVRPPVDPAGIHLGLKTHHAKAGDTLWVPISISSTGKDSLSSLQFDLDLDTTVVELLDAKVDTSLAPGWELQGWNRTAKSPVAIALAGTRRLVGPQEGELMRLKVRILPGVLHGASTQITLLRPLADEGRITSLTVAPGRIFVIPSGTVYGDVTGDGEVKLDDAQAILRHVVGELSLPSPQFPSFTLAIADVSGNGKITSYDAALVLHYSLGLLEEFPAPRETLMPRPVAFAKGAAARKAGVASLVVAAPVRVSGDTWRYRIEGTGLEGLLAGELELELLDYRAGFVQAASGVAGMRVTSRQRTDSPRIDLALAANRRLVTGAVSFLEVEVTHAAGSAVPVLALRGASLNEGALNVGSLGSNPTGIRHAVSDLPVNQLRISRASGRISLSVPGHRLKELAVFGPRGERLFSERLAVPAAELVLPREKLPAGVLFLRVRGETGRWQGVTTGLP